MKDLVIIGDSEHAEIASSYFASSSDYNPVAFAVPKSFRQKDELKGLPVLDFEDIETKFKPGHFLHAHVAIGSSNMNSNREKMYHATKAKGYTLANYISPETLVHSTVKMGDNNFIYELNNLQYGCNLGNNIIMWAGCHVGHRSIIEDNVFLTSHVVISGYCKVGKNSTLGVNSTLNDHIELGEFSFIGSGALVVKNTPANSLIKGAANFPELGINTLEKFGVK